MNIFLVTKSARTCFIAAALGCGVTLSSKAQSVTLFEWGINRDSVIYTTADPLPGFVNFGGFDFTTGLGTISASITGSGSHHFSLFVDHEIDEIINTYFNEYGENINTPQALAKQSWEIDEPGFVFGDIYDNFVAGSLDNLNAIPAGMPDDVSMALGWDFTLGAGQTAAITMNISESPPPAGFYLVQTDPDSSYSIYFSSQFRASGGGEHIPDEGSTLALLGFTMMGLACGVGLRWKLRAAYVRSAHV
jgi:hypothetical protein